MNKLFPMALLSLLTLNTVDAVEQQDTSFLKIDESVTAVNPLSEETLRFFDVNPAMQVLNIADKTLEYTHLLENYFRGSDALIQNSQFLPDTQYENALDRVLTFYRVHEWIHHDQAASAFNTLYNTLKPGGILGVVEYRSHLGGDKHLSYQVSEDYIIELARKAGFEFLAKSEVNADLRTPTTQVETLDDLALQHHAFGEHDSMTIKFIKPHKLAVMHLD